MQCMQSFVSGVCRINGLDHPVNFMYGDNLQVRCFAGMSDRRMLDSYYSAQIGISTILITLVVMLLNM